jgi:Protein of unknown function (DUF3592)
MVDALVQNLPLAFLLVFGLLTILVGVILTVVGFSTLREWLASASWPSVPARIVASEVEERQAFEGQLGFQPRVSFTYAAAGGEARSSRQAFAGKLYYKREQAEKALARYPVGMVVTARCHPEDPGVAVLERRGGVLGLCLLLLGLALILVPLAAAEFNGLPGRSAGLALAALLGLGWLSAWSSTRRRRKARRAGLYPPPGSGSDADVLRLLQAKEKLLAIRLYRDLHGTDLKTAKERVEAMQTESGGGQG